MRALTGKYLLRYGFAKLQVKMERNVSHRFLKLLWKNVSTIIDFQVRTNRGQEQNYKKYNQIRYINIINIGEC